MKFLFCFPPGAPGMYIGDVKPDGMQVVLLPNEVQFVIPGFPGIKIGATPLNIFSVRPLKIK